MKPNTEKNIKKQQSKVLGLLDVYDLKMTKGTKIDHLHDYSAILTLSNTSLFERKNVSTYYKFNLLEWRLETGAECLIINHLFPRNVTHKYTTLFIFKDLQGKASPKDLVSLIATQLGNRQVFCEKKTKVCSGSLKKPNEDLQAILYDFQFIAKSPSFEERMKELVPRFSHVIGFLALAGERILNANALINVQMEMPDIRKQENCAMDKKLEILEQSSHNIPVDTMVFELMMRRSFMSSKTFLRQKEVRLALSKIRKRTKTMLKTKLTNSHAVKRFDGEAVIESNCEHVTELKWDKHVITMLMSHDQRNFNCIKHVFIDASWIKKVMIVTVVAIVPIGVKKAYKTQVVFVVESREARSPKLSVGLSIHLISVLRERLPNIVYVTSDFEKPILSALDELGITRWGCIFHYKQALNRYQRSKSANISKEIYEIALILPMLLIKSVTACLKLFEDIEMLVTDEDDLAFLKYIQITYFRSLKTFNKNIILDATDSDEFFKLTNNAAERMFKFLKLSFVSTGPSNNVKDIKDCILLHFNEQEQEVFLTGGQSESQKFRYNRSTLEHNFLHARQLFDDKILRYELHASSHTLNRKKPKKQTRFSTKFCSEKRNSQDFIRRTCSQSRTRNFRETTIAKISNFDDKLTNNSSCADVQSYYKHAYESMVKETHAECQDLRRKLELFDSAQLECQNLRQRLEGFEAARVECEDLRRRVSELEMRMK